MQSSHMFTEDHTGHVLPEIYMNNNPLQPAISGESPSILPKLETTQYTSKVSPGKEFLFFSSSLPLF